VSKIIHESIRQCVLTVCWGMMFIITGVVLFQDKCGFFCWFSAYFFVWFVHDCVFWGPQMIHWVHRVNALSDGGLHDRYRSRHTSL